MRSWGVQGVVLAAAQTGSFVGTARQLGVKHSTVARRLDALEEALGLRLFLRDRQGLTLTEAGARVFDQASEMQRLATGIERTMAQPDDAVRGTVRLTTSESFTHFLVRRLARLRAMHEDLIVEVLTTNAPVDLLNRHADIAVRFMATSEQSLMQRSIGTVGWGLYGSKTEMGMGLGVMPCFLESADANLVRLDDRVLGTRSAWLVAHPDVARIPRVRTVIEFVVAMMKEEAAVLSGERPTSAD